MMQNNFDIKQVYRFWDVFKNGNQLTEIRLIASDGRTGSGYCGKTLVDLT